jgi:hypothetical protein
LLRQVFVVSRYGIDGKTLKTGEVGLRYSEATDSQNGLETLTRRLMGDITTPGDCHPEDSSLLTRALLALSAHRYLVFASGVCLLVIAAWCGSQISTASRSVEADDSYAEIDGYQPTEAPRFGDAGGGAASTPPAFPPLTGGLQWGQPEPPPSPSQLPSLGFELPATPSSAFAPSAVSSAPTWLVGTIETDDDAPGLPAWNPSPFELHYSRNAKNAEPTTLR